MANKRCLILLYPTVITKTRCVKNRNVPSSEQVILNAQSTLRLMVFSLSIDISISIMFQSRYKRKSWKIDKRHRCAESTECNSKVLGRCRKDCLDFPDSDEDLPLSVLKRDDQSAVTPASSVIDMTVSCCINI